MQYAIRLWALSNLASRACHRVRLDQCDQRYSSDQFGVDGSLGAGASLNNHSHAVANHHDRPSF